MNLGYVKNARKGSIMKILIDIDLDGYDDPKQYRDACIQAVTEGPEDFAHASVSLLWAEEYDDRMGI